MTIDTMGNLTILWTRNDTALAYNYRYRLLGDTTWEVDATRDSFFVIDELEECVEYEVSISTVCPFDTSTYTLDTVISFCPNATRPVLIDPDLLSIYPVPFAESLTISALDPSLNLDHITVRSIDGRQIISQRNANARTFETSTIQWNRGMYLIEIKTNLGWHFQKVLKL